MHIDPETAIYGSAGAPLDYPSTLRPQAWYVDGTDAVDLTWDWRDPQAVRLASSQHALADLSPAARRAVESIPRRIPQIAFGANRDLANLAWKFLHYARRAGAAPEPFFVLPATVPNAAVVMCNVGYWGYLYAALLTDRSGDPRARQLVAGHAAPVAVLLLTARQMGMIHRSEGVPDRHVTARAPVSCDVALLDACCLGARLACQAYALPVPYLSFDAATPVPFPSAVTDTAAQRQGAQRDAWRRILAHPAIAGRCGDRVRTGDDVVTLLRSHTERSHTERSDRRELLGHIRDVIAHEMCLRDATGELLDPRAGLTVLAPHQAWRPGPVLADALAR